MKAIGTLLMLCIVATAGFTAGRDRESRRLNPGERQTPYDAGNGWTVVRDETEAGGKAIWLLLVWPHNPVNAGSDWSGLDAGYVFRAIDRGACEKRVARVVAKGGHAICTPLLDPAGLPERMQ